MNNFNKLSLAGTGIALALLLGGCSQQQVSGDSSQVAGSSQQVAGSSQQTAGSSQQVSKECPECAAPKVEPVATPPTPAATTTKVTPPPRTVSGHTHPANKCTNTIRHNHPNGNRPHTHRYSCQGSHRTSDINIHALQRKLKAKGYYKGPITGVINADTREALQRYQQRRRK